MKVSIIGLGLIGGSIALSLKNNPAYTISGVESNQMHADEAVKLGLVDKLNSLEEALKDDIVILSTPVDACIDILQKYDFANKNTTIIDVGSTKEKISKAVNGAKREQLVAAHPMAGTEYSGPSAAMSGLFESKTVVICDKELSGEEHIQKATQIFLDMKMKIIEMDSKTHDMHAAYISHLPHIISYSIANTVLDRENPTDILSMAAGGFRDMSRLAKSRPDLWTQIFRQNKENLLESVSFFEENLTALKELVKKDDWEGLQKALTKAQGLHSIF